ncbi:ERI1 exoribonuclease 3 isoform X1 [Dendropsophus ebraccatus]|uniref:ERI1 exoribonuclease 3 isoform X1 n=2 Tax=Dendropsophus ebraccatus TaxID=150705 RepID=UPI003831139C
MIPCRRGAERGLRLNPARLSCYWLSAPAAASLIGGRHLPVTAVSIDRGRVRGFHVNAAEVSMQLSSLIRPQRLPSLLLSRPLGTASSDPFSVLRSDTGADPMLNRKLGCQGFGASVAAMTSFPPQRYHYFLVLDFEATCDKPQIHPQEIIEFPILKLNGRTMEIESTFHTYVQPVVHPQLTPFCTELTGIIQEMVDGQPTLSQVLERVDEWMAKEGLLDPSVKSIFVTCGDWDLKLMLPGQCEYLGLQVADYFKQWINLKKAYSFAIGTWPKNGLLDMNKGMSLQHIGRPHSGIDDCRNIANIMKTLAHRGFIFKQTSRRI